MRVSVDKVVCLLGVTGKEFNSNRISYLRGKIAGLGHTKNLVDEFLLVSAKWKIAKTQLDFLCENPEHIGDLLDFAKLVVKVYDFKELLDFLKVMVDITRATAKAKCESILVVSEFSMFGVCALNQFVALPSNLFYCSNRVDYIL